MKPQTKLVSSIKYATKLDAEKFGLSLSQVIICIDAATMTGVRLKQQEDCTIKSKSVMIDLLCRENGRN
jgi:hypothetical protein